MARSFVVALAGASGSAYGIRLIGALLGLGHDVEMIVSPTAKLIAEDEIGLDIEGPDAEVAGKVMDFIGPAIGDEDHGTLSYYPSDLITAPLSSGSALRRTMVICPSSMGTIGRIASGVSFNLIDRSADCVLKEKGELVLVPRETPLNAIHLENLLKLSRAGATIVPAMPAFYNKPATIDDMVDFMVGKVLDILGVENSLFKRWEGDGGGKG
ncbi:MAG: flavin prenyltransferase UbiX [Thermodesulfobacteriota bacterium]